MNLHIYSIAALILFFFALPSSVDARKKDKNERSINETCIVEPDMLAVKARKDRKIVRALALQTHSHSNANINSKYREGIDVSHYQGSIDWDQVAGSSKISYVYLKATEGASLVDNTYERNLAEARRVGLSVGSYHFYRPNISWRQQFENLTSVVKRDDQDLVPIIDIEHKGSCSDEKFISDLTSFINEVTRYYGKKPLLYTFHNFYNRHLSGHFMDYHWMIARYRSDMPTLDDGKDYVIWQYTSSGSIPGIKGNVDRSRLMGDYSLHHVQL